MFPQKKLARKGLNHWPLGDVEVILEVWFLAATKQLFEWFSQSVRLSVCLSITHMFLSSYYHEIFRSDYYWQIWCPYKRSRSQRSKPNLAVSGLLNQIWIHIWWWNDVQGLMWHRRNALLFFKVIRQISRSHRTNIANFDPIWAFPDCNPSLNHRRLWNDAPRNSSVEEVRYCFWRLFVKFQGQTGQKIADSHLN